MSDAVIWTELYKAGDLSLSEANERGLRRFVVMDLYRYRVRFFPHPEQGTLGVGIDAEWSEDKPGQLASYTPSYESSGDECQPGDVTISHDGLLSVMAKQRTARMTIRKGWTAQLPREAVEPIRRAIALAEAVLQEARPSRTADGFIGLFAGRVKKPLTIEDMNEIARAGWAGELDDTKGGTTK